MRRRIFPHLQDLLGVTIGGQRGTQPIADRPSALGGHQPGAHAHPGMVIDPGQRLGRRAIRQWKPAHHIHLPQLHRRATFPAFPLARTPIPQTRIDHRRPHQRPISRRLRRQRRHSPFGQLEHQPPWSPIRARPPQLQQFPRPRRASDADTTPADATDPPAPQDPRPHTGPARHAASGVCEMQRRGANEVLGLANRGSRFRRGADRPSGYAGAPR